MKYFEQQNLLKNLASILVILGLMSVFLIAYHFFIRFLFGGEGLGAFHPIVSDESSYFRFISSLVQYGPVNGGGYNGYYFNGELFTAKILNYGAHGFFLLWPYYLLFLIFGIKFLTVIVSNWLLLAFAFLAVYFLTKNLRKTLIVVLASLLFLPVLLYFGSFLMEISQYVFAIITAALLWHYKNNRSRIVEIALVSIIFLFCVSRIINFLFFIPYIVLKSKNNKQPILFSLALFAVILVCCYGIFSINSLFAAPYPTGFLYELKKTFADRGILEGVYFLKDHIVLNTNRLFDTSEGIPAWIIMRYSLIIMFILFFVRGFFYYDYQNHKLSLRNEKDLLSLSFSMVVILILGLDVALYDIFGYRDFRVFAPFALFFMTYFLINSRMKSIIPLLFIGFHLALLSQYTCLKTPVTIVRWTETEYPHFVNELRYDESAKSRWDNTVLTNLGAEANTHIMLEKDSRLGWIILRSPIINSESLQCGYILLAADSPSEYLGYEIIAHEKNQYLYKRIFSEHNMVELGH
ncbi:MAG: hypothetical protein FWD67_00805 [Betaproteobacteria bacterium]|nr:hypothetical protein [Betaproteobacteria bacterium]